jgi:hypothetical protein
MASSRKGSRVLDLDIDQCDMATSIDSLSQGWNSSPTKEPHIANTVKRHLVDALRSLRQPRQIVVVKHHHLARSAALDVKLDTVGAVGHGPAESLQGVFGCKRARASMGEDPRPLASLSEKNSSTERLRHHRACTL